jgi:PAS domain S-box-containing protein
MSDTPDQDLKQQLQTTRAERDRLRAVLDGLPMGLYVISQNYDLEYVNPALQKVIGSPDGRTCHDQIHGLASPCTWCKNRQVFQGDIVRWEWSADNGQSFDLFDYRIVNADGSLSKVEVFNDITELKKSRQQLELASSLARVGYWDWTMATGALYWSDETYRVFGYEPGDLPPSYEWFIGQIHPDDRDYVDRMVQRSITTGADYQVDFRYFDRHGNLRSGRATGRVRFHLDGRPINLFGAMQDVTTLKNNEARPGQSNPASPALRCRTYRCAVPRPETGAAADRSGSFQNRQRQSRAPGGGPHSARNRSSAEQSAAEGRHHQPFWG